MSKINQELIEKAAEKHGEVFVLEVANKSIELASSGDKAIEDLSDEFKPEWGYSYAVLRRPDKRILGFAMTYKDPIQMGSALLKNCIVELEKDNLLTDDDILNDEQVNIAASLEVTQLIDIRAAKLKKYLRKPSPSAMKTQTVSDS